MFELFMMGGPLFMGIISIIFLIALMLSIRLGTLVSQRADLVVIDRYVGWIKSVGLLALVVGVLGQFLGLFAAFQAIESQGGISPSVLAGGLKISSITTIYGLICYALSLIITTVIRGMAKY